MSFAGTALDRDIKTYMLVKGQPKSAIFRFQPTGITWVLAGKLSVLPNEEIESFTWSKAATGNELGILTNSGSKFRFIGFKDDLWSDIASHIKTYAKKDVKTIDVARKGWNWGDAKFDGNLLKFLVDSKLAFELPLSSVSATNMNKSDVTVDFRQDDGEDESQFQLVNMKFVVPVDYNIEEDEAEMKRRKEAAAKRKEERRQAKALARAKVKRERGEMEIDGAEQNASEEDEDDDDDEDDEEEEDRDALPAAIFHQRVLSRADIDKMTGECFVSLSDISCLTPRGSFRVDFYSGGINLHGQSYDYKIDKTAIKDIFLLPPPNEHRVYLILHLKSAISRGNTKYDYIIFFLEKEEEDILVDLALTEEEIAANYGDKIKPHMQGPRFQVLNNLFRALSGRKTIQPAKTFQSHRSEFAVKCALGSNNGYLFPLESALIFAHKPTLHIPFNDIARIEFERGNSTTRSFDMTIYTKAKTKHVFNSIPKEEQNNLLNFLKSKELKVKVAEATADVPRKQESDEGSSDEDSYMRKMKQEGKAKESGGGGDDFDSEDEDDDFQAGSEDEPGEEYDENYTSDSSDDGSGSSGSDSGSGDDDDEDGASKHKKASKEKSKPKKKSKPSSPKKKKESSSSGTKKAAAKKTKDKNAPKRPLSSYMLWTNANRSRIKSANPTADIKAIATLMGAEWNALPEAEKAEWSERANEAKKVYEVQKREYDASKAARGEDSDEEEEVEEKKKKSSSSSSSSSSAAASKKKVSSDKGKFKSAEFINSSDED